MVKQTFQDQISKRQVRPEQAIYITQYKIFKDFVTDSFLNRTFPKGINIRIPEAGACCCSVKLQHNVAISSDLKGQANMIIINCALKVYFVCVVWTAVNSKGLTEKN